MSPIVIDTSITMSWCFEDEATDATWALLDRVAADGAVVPALWTIEVANVLAVAERRRRITEAQAARFDSLLARLPITVAPEAPMRSSLRDVARQHGLTAHDASYLWLAATRGLPLATSDAHLREACTEAGIDVVSA